MGIIGIFLYSRYLDIKLWQRRKAFDREQKEILLQEQISESLEESKS